MLNKMLQKAQTVAIGGHERPDGDCIGSCMGMYRYIKNNYPEIQVNLYLEPIADKFRFIRGTEDILSEIDEEKRYDLFISLDCGDRARLGFSEPLFCSAAHTLCIDHHVSNGSFAEENYIRESSVTPVHRRRHIAWRQICWNMDLMLRHFWILHSAKRHMHRIR